MIKYSVYISFLILLASCTQKEVKNMEKQPAPTVKNGGATLVFPSAESTSVFKTEVAGTKKIDAELNAPGKVAATVMTSGEGASRNIVLFNNPELSAHYTQLVQLQIQIAHIQEVAIRQKQLELERIKDLQAHGSATGQELLNAETELLIEQNNLANERASLIEHETQLKAGGFDPKALRNARAGIAYLISDIPENQIDKIKPGHTGNIHFTAFPNESFTGKVEAIADLVDNDTRMVKVRISVNNASGKIKSGMYSTVSFGITEGDFKHVDQASLITVQGKHYVFVKVAENEFERREIKTGQQIGHRIIVFGGLEPADEIVVEGVMQLKGLSFGY